MKRLFCLLVLSALFAAAAPLAAAADASKLVGTWKGRGIENDGAISLTFQAGGQFELYFEGKDGPVNVHGSYATDVSAQPWKLTLTMTPSGNTVTIRTVVAMLSDGQLLIQKAEPDAPMPEKFTKESAILDRAP